MSVYVDPMMPCIPNPRWRWRENCHLTADSLEELHAFASRLGLKRAWFQAHARWPHYDLTRGMRERAVRIGAVELTHEERNARLRSALEARP